MPAAFLNIMIAVTFYYQINFSHLEFRIHISTCSNYDSGESSWLWKHCIERIGNVQYISFHSISTNKLPSFLKLLVLCYITKHFNYVIVYRLFTENFLTPLHNYSIYKQLLQSLNRIYLQLAAVVEGFSGICVNGNMIFRKF